VLSQRRQSPAANGGWLASGDAVWRACCQSVGCLSSVLGAPKEEKRGPGGQVCCASPAACVALRQVDPVQVYSLRGHSLTHSLAHTLAHLRNPTLPSLARLHITACVHVFVYRRPLTSDTLPTRVQVFTTRQGVLRCSSEAAPLLSFWPLQRDGQYLPCRLRRQPLQVRAVTDGCRWPCRTRLQQRT